MFGSSMVTELERDTKAVSNQNFLWTDNVIGDISQSDLIRIELTGTKESYVALCETNDHYSKKATYTFGGWNNSMSTPGWVD